MPDYHLSSSIDHLTPQAIEHIAYYLVLAPHDNEQSDMLHRIFRLPVLEKLELTR